MSDTSRELAEIWPGNAYGAAVLFETAVIGGGPSGCAAAAELARAGHAILLIDGPVRDRPWAGETLAAGAADVIRKHFGAAILDGVSSGPYVNRPLLDQRLRAAVQELGVTVRSDQRMAEVNARTLADLGANWIIDASGRDAQVARAYGARRVRSEHLVAEYAVIQRKTPLEFRAGHGPAAFESFDHGSWYTIPVPPDHRSVVYLTDPGRITAAALPWHDMLDKTSRIKQLAGRGIDGVVPSMTDAAATRLTDFAGPNWIAVGDAAMAWEPLSPRGLLTAVQLGIRGAQAIDAAIASGDTQPLKEYAEDCYALWESTQSDESERSTA